MKFLIWNHYHDIGNVVSSLLIHYFADVCLFQHSVTYSPNILPQNMAQQPLPEEKVEDSSLLPTQMPSWLKNLEEKLGVALHHQGDSEEAFLPVLKALDELATPKPLQVANEDIAFTNTTMGRHYHLLDCNCCYTPLLHPITLPCQHNFSLTCLSFRIRQQVQQPVTANFKGFKCPEKSHRCLAVFGPDDLKVLFDNHKNTRLDTMIQRLMPEWLKTFDETRARTRNYRQAQSRLAQNINSLSNMVNLFFMI